MNLRLMTVLLLGSMLVTGCSGRGWLVDVGLAGPAPYPSTVSYAKPSPTPAPHGIGGGISGGVVSRPGPMVTPQPAPSPWPSFTPTPYPTATSGPIEAPDAFTLVGTGQMASSRFPLAGGMTIFRLNHRGKAPFSASLLNAKGETVARLVDAEGDFFGSAGLGAPSGEYILDVQGDGPWSVTVEQPRPVDAEVRTQFSGSGRSVAGPLRMTQGLKVVAMRHEGASSFAVCLLNAQGHRVASLTNTSGGFNGSKALGVEAGIYYFDIQADGVWSLNIY